MLKVNARLDWFVDLEPGITLTDMGELVQQLTCALFWADGFVGMTKGTLHVNVTFPYWSMLVIVATGGSGFTTAVQDELVPANVFEV